jgi:hypothetical protein
MQHDISSSASGSFWNQARKVGLGRLLLGIGIFATGLFAFFASAKGWLPVPSGIMGVVLFGTLLNSFVMVPQGGLEALTGKPWAESPSWMRSLALVGGIPAFLGLAFAVLVISSR